ncbi:MAG: hypothetical protein WDN72_00580 [Alphaproteobacteria bacterium]
MPRLWLPALGFPAVFVNLGHGQNGFLTAGPAGLCAGAARPVARAGGDMFRAARLQAAIRPAHPAGAARGRALARFSSPPR